MSKYYNAEDVLAIFSEEERPLNWTDSEAEIQAQNDFDYYKGMIESLPTIEVSEDCISRIAIRDELYRYNLDCDMNVEWHKGFATATKMVESFLYAPSVVPTAYKLSAVDDCISREWVLKAIDAEDVGTPDEMWRPAREYVEMIKNAPSVVPKARPIEMHLDVTDDVIDRVIEQMKGAEGEWQITDAYPHNVYCSECHKKFAQTHWAVWEDGSLPRNYCPNCGAKMKG